MIDILIHGRMIALAAHLDPCRGLGAMEVPFFSIVEVSGWGFL